MILKLDEYINEARISSPELDALRKRRSALSAQISMKKKAGKDYSRLQTELDDIKSKISGFVPSAAVDDNKFPFPDLKTLDGAEATEEDNDFYHLRSKVYFQCEDSNEIRPLISDIDKNIERRIEVLMQTDSRLKRLKIAKKAAEDVIEYNKTHDYQSKIQRIILNNLEVVKSRKVLIAEDDMPKEIRDMLEPYVVLVNTGKNVFGKEESHYELTDEGRAMLGMESKAAEEQRKKEEEQRKKEEERIKKENEARLKAEKERLAREAEEKEREAKRNAKIANMDPSKREILEKKKKYYNTIKSSYPLACSKLKEIIKEFGYYDKDYDRYTVRCMSYNDLNGWIEEFYYYGPEAHSDKDKIHVNIYWQGDSTDGNDIIAFNQNGMVIAGNSRHSEVEFDKSAIFDAILSVVNPEDLK